MPRSNKSDSDFNKLSNAILGKPSKTDTTLDNVTSDSVTSDSVTSKTEDNPSTMKHISFIASVLAEATNFSDKEIAQIKSTTVLFPSLSVVDVPIKALLSIVNHSGLQYDVVQSNVKSIIFDKDTGLLSTGTLLQPILLTKDAKGNLLIESGRNRIFALAQLLASKADENNIDFLSTKIPCVLVQYANPDVVYKAIVSANQSRRMSTVETTLTTVSSLVSEVSIEHISSASDSLDDKKLKVLLSTLIREKLAEKYGNVATVGGHEFTFRGALGSKFFLDYLYAILPKKADLKPKKQTHISVSTLESLVNLILSVPIDLSKVNSFATYVHNSKTKGMTIDLGYFKGIPSVLLPIVLHKHKGNLNVARSITKSQCEGLDSLKAIFSDLVSFEKLTKLATNADVEEKTVISTPSPSIDIRSILENTVFDDVDI